MKHFDEDKLIDHDYDGIQEYDNPIPGWLNFILWGSILFTLVYLPYYHLMDGPSSLEEYHAEMQAAAKARQALQEKMAKADPQEVMADEGRIARGDELFAQSCAACHAQDGSGNIGPNLRDSVWKNGDGSFASVVNLISEGVPAAGMPAWSASVSPQDIQNLAARILTWEPMESETAPAAGGDSATAAQAPASDGQDGAAVFATYCASCHKADGSGLVGPNLIDDEWLNVEPNLESVAQFVAEGNVEKGMPAWQAVIGDDGVDAVSQYILEELRTQ